jgi:hypothetical protein
MRFVLALRLLLSACTSWGQQPYVATPQSTPCDDSCVPGFDRKHRAIDGCQVYVSDSADNVIRIYRCGDGSLIGTKTQEGTPSRDVEARGIVRPRTAQGAGSAVRRKPASARIEPHRKVDSHKCGSIKAEKPDGCGRLVDCEIRVLGAPPYAAGILDLRRSESRPTDTLLKTAQGTVAETRCARND